MAEITASSYYKIGKILLEKSYEEHEEKNFLYDSSYSYMKPGNDKLNSSSYLDFNTSSLKFGSSNKWYLSDKFIHQQTTNNT